MKIIIDSYRQPPAHLKEVSDSVEDSNTNPRTRYLIAALHCLPSRPTSRAAEAPMTKVIVLSDECIDSLHFSCKYYCHDVCGSIGGVFGKPTVRGSALRKKGYLLRHQSGLQEDLGSE